MTNEQIWVRKGLFIVGPMPKRNSAHPQKRSSESSKAT